MSSEGPVIWFTRARKEVLTLRIVSANRPLPSAKLLISSPDSPGAAASPLTSVMAAMEVAVAAAVIGVEPKLWFVIWERDTEFAMVVMVGVELMMLVGVVPPLGALMRAARAEETPPTAEVTPPTAEVGVTVVEGWGVEDDETAFITAKAAAAAFEFVAFAPLCGDFPLLSPPFFAFFRAPPPLARALGRPGRPRVAIPPGPVVAPLPEEEPEVFCGDNDMEDRALALRLATV